MQSFSNFNLKSNFLMLDQPHLLPKLPALREINPAFLNLQPPKIPKSTGTLKRQHPESYTELAAV
jgi:hypothetical protein